MARRQYGCEWSSGSLSNLVEEPSGNEELIRRLLRLVGTPGRSWINFRLPEDVHLFAVKKDWWPRVWLQAAGTAQAMTVECRRVDDDGVERLYTLGYGGPRDAVPRVVVSFNDGAASTLVYPDEMFDAAEAGDIFCHYFETEAVPDGYALRVHDDVE